MNILTERLLRRVESGGLCGQYVWHSLRRAHDGQVRLYQAADRRSGALAASLSMPGPT